ncbi:hypothetical protein Tco_1342652, partial [Tanacetum coccineum]
MLQDRAETLAQQQAAAFQLQFDTLRTELQATRGLLLNRAGGGGDQGLLLPRSMRLDVPKFTGDDPERWIFAITEYFTLLNTPADQRLRIVGFNLEGAAAEWFRWMSQNGLITDWERFVECDAFSLACITKARLDDQAMLVSVTATKSMVSSGGQRQSNPRFGVPSSLVTATKPSLLPTPAQTTVTTNSKPLAIKWISPAERQERMSKGLCFNCDTRWTRGHKCPGKFLLLMTEDEDDTGTAVQDEGEDVVESGDISILNSLVGHGSPRSLQLWGAIGKEDVHVLIDNGSTHNFIRPDVAEKMCLPIQPTK